MTPGCFLAAFSGLPCEGALVKAHLIPKQLMRRTVPKGAVRIDGVWQRPVEALFILADELDPPRRTLRELQEDSRSWVPACGGLTGISGHHGMLDHSRLLRIPRFEIPEHVEEYARELGLMWWIDREYGPLEQAA